MENIKVDHSKLKNLVVGKLKKAGLGSEHAEIVADVLVHADLRGVSSHGVLRTEHYVKRLKEGGLNPSPRFVVNLTGPSSAVFDGDNGIGHVIAKKAMEKAVQIAEENGVGMVGVNNSSHCGALSYFVQQAASEKTIGMAMTQTDKAVVPFGGAEPYFGTNPIAFGFPAQKRPLILDMATSNVALGKILYARETGKKVPLDWGVNEKGIPTDDPNQIKSLLPTGGPKGYGLAMVVDILSGILTGSAFGPNITAMYGDYHQNRKLGHFFWAIDPRVFTDEERFLNQVDELIDGVHKAKSAEGFESVMVPGEPEQIAEEKRLMEGIPIPKTVIEYLNS